MAGESRRELLLQLQSIFADLYRTNERALELADRAGLEVASIPQSSRPRSTWWSILTEADHQLAVPKLVTLARQEYPRHEGLRLAAGDQLADVVGPDVEWRAPAGREVVVGDNDLLPVAFLETGAAIAKSVVRIALGERQYGSGFLIAPDLVLTNQHVLPSLEVAQRAVIELGCQETLAGVAIAGVPHATRAGEVYAADEAADWAVVKIEPVAGCTPISLAAGDLAVPKVGERVYIIQHPGGGPKEVALGDNAVTYVDDQRIQYLTDTRPGSSGSPVFDRRWRLVALHHSGGWMTEGDDPNAKDLKFRNEGVPIGVVRAALVKARLVQ